MPGYAVVDVETTGLSPGKHDRIAEVAVVVLDDVGNTIETYETLVNPERDLGPQSIHQLVAADIRRAPTFAQIAGQLLALLDGRLLVAHNVAFDLLFLAAEFDRLDVTLPVARSDCLCTMALARDFLRGSGRSLECCCEQAGVGLVDAHSALGDATAASQLLCAYLRQAGAPPPWFDLLSAASQRRWHRLPTSAVAPLPRSAAAARRREQSHFLGRLALRSGPSAAGAAEEYLAVLDRVLLDRLISDTESDQLVELAAHLSLDRAAAEAAHRQYLLALAAAAWEDYVITADERRDLEKVAVLLQLPPRAVDDALHATAPQPIPNPRPPSGGPVDRFVLRRGDTVVLTGQMTLPRDVWERRIAEAGLIAGDGVTKKTSLLVAADPDSLSGKARKANSYGIPIVTERAFAEMVASLSSATV